MPLDPQLPVEALWPALALACAWLFDRAFGELPASLHPVVWMGHAIRPLVRLARLEPPAWLGFLGGMWGSLAVIALAVGLGLIPNWLLSVAPALAPESMPALPWIARGIEVLLLSSSFACAGLLSAGEQVARQLAAGDLPASRAAVGGLCSRDTSALDEPALAGAAIESITENHHDSVVGPLLFYVAFGLPGAMAFRAVNTLDAMIGYRGAYEWVGKFAARLDDVLGYLPARLSTLLLALSARSLGMVAPAGGAAVGSRSLAREARKTDSPNAGWPMAYASAVLGVRLAKQEHYVLGADRREPTGADILRAVGLVRRAAWLGWLGCTLALLAAPWLTSQAGP